MAFEKINKVSEQELTPDLLEKINSKAATIDFLSHKNNTTVHISAEERALWNSTLLTSETYTDDKIRAAVGSIPDPTQSINTLLNTKLNITDFNSFKTTLSTVALTGSYNDLLNKPSQVAYSDNANNSLTSNHALLADLATVATTANYATSAGNAATVGGIRVTIGGAAPSTPVNLKELWFDTSTQAIKIYNNGWLQTKSVWS